MAHPPVIETRLAVLSWNALGVLEIRFKPDVPADVAGVGEIVEARLRMTEGMQALVMTVLTPDMDFEIQVPTSDHHSPTADHTLAEATVAPTPMLDRIARMYYQYFAPGHPTGVFSTEAEALSWLKQHPVA